MDNSHVAPDMATILALQFTACKVSYSAQGYAFVKQPGGTWHRHPQSWWMLLGWQCLCAGLSAGQCYAETLVQPITCKSQDTVSPALSAAQMGPHWT